MAEAAWPNLPLDKRNTYVSRVRAKAATAAAGATEEVEVIRRVFEAGEPVPRVLWGRNKGLEVVLRERGLYPEAGLKGACEKREVAQRKQPLLLPPSDGSAT